MKYERKKRKRLKVDLIAQVCEFGKLFKGQETGSKEVEEDENKELIALNCYEDLCFQGFCSPSENLCV